MSFSGINISWDHFKQAGRGLATGYTFSRAKYNEDTIKQGKNYILAFPFLSAQIGLLAADILSVTGKLLKDQASYIQNLASAGISITAISMMGIGLVSACLKFSQTSPKDKETGEKASIFDLPANILRVKLSEKNFKRVERVAEFIVEHAGSIAQISEIALCVFKFCMGNAVEPITSLLMMGVGVLDRRGYLPMKVSIVLNKYMPVVAATAMILAGTPLQKVFGVATIISLVAPALLNYLKHPFDDWIHKKYAELGVSYPTLREIEKPQKKAQLTLEDIEKFDPTTVKLKVDAYHLSQMPRLDLDISNIDFNDLLTHFIKISWIEPKRFSAVQKKCLDDDRFKSLVKETLVGSDSPRKKLFEAVFDRDEAGDLQQGKDRLWLLKKDLPEELIHEWQSELVMYMHSELVMLKNTLTYDTRPAGDLGAFDACLHRAKQVVAYLNMTKNQVRKEDILMNLAITGGNYCLQGIDRGVRYGLESALTDGNSKVSGVEARILHSLSQQRDRIVEGWFEKVGELSSIGGSPLLALFKCLLRVAGISQGEKIKYFGLSNDLHVFNEFKKGVSPGTGVDIESAANDRTLSEASPLSDMGTSLFPQYRLAFWMKRNPKVKKGEIQVTKKLYNFVMENLEEIKKEIQLASTNLIEGKILDGVQHFFKYYWINLKNTPSMFLLLGEFTGNYFSYNDQSVLQQMKEEFFYTFDADDCNRWWNDYMRNFDEEDQDKLLELYSDKKTGALEEIEMEIDGKLVIRKRIREKWLQLMLIEMGVLKIEEDSTAAETVEISAGQMKLIDGTLTKLSQAAKIVVGNNWEENCEKLEALITEDKEYRNSLAALI